MTELNFHTDTPFPYFDPELNTNIYLLADWTVLADTEKEIDKSTIPFYTATMMNNVLPEYSGKLPYKELPGRYDEINAAVSAKLTEKMSLRCDVKLRSFKPDERSAKFIEQLELTNKMKDPAYAAAELERAMQKARETAEKNGIDLSSPENMKMPDLPPLPETDDPLARAQAIAAQAEKIRKMAAEPAAPTAKEQQREQRSREFQAMSDAEKAKIITGSMISDDRSFKGDCVPMGLGMTQPGGMSADMMQNRPKFCKHCGAALKYAGNFCGNCGKSIL